MTRFRKFLFCIAIVLVASSAFAQTTASLSGTASTDGAPLPGVTVTISSPNLQGTRTAVTGDAGGYNFGALPPGEYTVVFDLGGMQTVTKRVRIGVGQSGSVDADLKVAAVAEAITVTAAAPSVLETPSVSTNMTSKFIDDLPINRGVLNAAVLAPGVNANTFSNGQLSISGGPGYDNLVMVNGVAITEAVRSQSLDLFIEDAIQETTVLTGAISAEYGRFTGGVVNSITKSGGNQFSGSLRDSFTNPSWNNRTPPQITNNTRLTDKLSQVYEGTLGGYVMKDRLWFFTAGRDTETSTDVFTRPVPGTTNSLNATRVDTERRLEGKLTAQITAKHNLSGSYLDVDSSTTNFQFTALSYDLASLTDRSDPQTLKSAHYNGVLTNNWMVEAQYSAMEWGVGVGGGSQFTDFVRGTILRNRADSNSRFNSPTFCGVCDRETRSNDNITLKTNYYLSSKGFGNHSLVAGVEDFSEHRFANNYQSGSNFRFFVNGVTRIGDDLYPRVNPGTASAAAVLMWTPIFALQLNESDLETKSAFFNDRWDLNDHWSFSLGVRYDKNAAVDSSGFKVSDDSKFSPRLNATYDVLGNGRHRLTASYGDYASRIVDGPATSAASNGNPGALYFNYLGPAFNQPGTPNDQLLTSAQVLERVYDWLTHACDSQGRCGTDNLSLLRATGPGGFPNSVPGFDARIASSLSSPYMRELTLGYGTQWFSNLVTRVDLVSRNWSNFYATRVDNSTPKVKDFLGIDHDIGIIENTNDINREYKGVQLQANWRPRRFNVGLNYTYAELTGNDEQESANSGTIGNFPGRIYYSELSNFELNQPDGWLAGDVRHRARAWVGYDIPMPRLLGAVNITVLQNFDSGTPYSAVQFIDMTPYHDALLANTNYTTPLEGVQYYFSDRGAFRLDDVSSTNISLNYRYPIGRFELFAQGDLVNAFDRHTIVNPNITVNTAWTSAAFRPFNPFTETPVECPKGTAAAQCTAMGAHWQKGANFGLQANTAGQGTFTAGFQQTRMYRFSAGVRF